ncbi:MAG: hypothetical protein Cons2KO_14430 [Congregibacter sp.]
MIEQVPSTPTLKPLCSVALKLRTPIMIGEGPVGKRMVVDIETMSLSGARLNAELAGRAAADWLTIAQDVATIDVRATLETHDGANIYLQYRGRTDVSAGLGSSPVIVAPIFETSDERYLWLNAVQAIGKGDIAALRYEWYEIQ